MIRIEMRDTSGVDRGYGYNLDTLVSLCTLLGLVNFKLLNFSKLAKLSSSKNIVRKVILQSSDNIM